jgi:hypothetical protein
MNNQLDFNHRSDRIAGGNLGEEPDRFASYRFEPILVWKIIGFFLVLYVPVLWFCTICVGCLIMIPVEIWRFSQRRAKTDLKKTAPEEVLWDRLLDGPERP